MPPIVSLSTPKPAMLSSKWLYVPVLIDAQEMQELFKALGNFFIYKVSCITKKGVGGISQASFLQQYEEYIRFLQEGQIPPEDTFRHLFSSVFTYTEDALFAVEVQEERQIIRVQKPVVQLQPHRMGYSQADGKFRSKTFGPDTISWGILFSYPQLFQESQSHEVLDVDDHFPNTELFRNLQKWVRHHTSATPFIIGDQKINVPMRLGKKCFSWINHHPQLIAKGIKVKL